MPAKAGIQVTDSVRHTVGKLVPYSDTGRYPGWGMDPGFHRGDDKAWIPASAGMTKRKVENLQSRFKNPLNYNSVVFKQL